MPPGGLPFLFRQEREERSRAKGVAERSESSNVMIASGNHTLSIASDKCCPVAVPGIFVGVNAFLICRPLPLAQLALSATGGARIAPP